MENKTSEVFAIAEKEIGVKEIWGRKANPRIVEYDTATDLKATSDEVAWCSAFVNWCFREAGLKGTGKANARSWLNWGIATTTPEKGDVVVFWRGQKDGYLGHVGFYAGEDEDTILVLGGNQNNQVCLHSYLKSQLLGFRKML